MACERPATRWPRVSDSPRLQPTGAHWVRFPARRHLARCAQTCCREQGWEIPAIRYR